MLLTLMSFGFLELEKKDSADCSKLVATARNSYKQLQGHNIAVLLLTVPRNDGTEKKDSREGSNSQVMPKHNQSPSSLDQYYSREGSNNQLMPPQNGSPSGCTWHVPFSEDLPTFMLVSLFRSVEYTIIGFLNGLNVMFHKDIWIVGYTMINEP
eukprot:scaffold363_cov56-Cylindrotheca_fusiformis.AAC.12